MSEFDFNLKNAKWRRSYNFWCRVYQRELWKEHPEWGESRIVQEAQKKAVENADKHAAQPGFCYIATAVYGSYDAPQVLTLRRFRDEVLAESYFGRLFIKTYYRFSPPVAERLKSAKRVNLLVRKVLDMIVERI